MISPTLCAPVLLGLPFLQHNNIVVDVAARSAVDKLKNFDLLNPPTPQVTTPPRHREKFNYEEHKAIVDERKKVVQELKSTFTTKHSAKAYCATPVGKFDVIGAVHV